MTLPKHAMSCMSWFTIYTLHFVTLNMLTFHKKTLHYKYSVKTCNIGVNGKIFYHNIGEIVILFICYQIITLIYQSSSQRSKAD